MDIMKIKEEIKIINECLKGASSDVIKVALYNRRNLLSRIRMKIENDLPLTEAERGAI